VIPLVAWLRGRRAFRPRGAIRRRLVPSVLATFPGCQLAWRWRGWPCCRGAGSPQRVDDKRQVHEQGYDIMLVVDLSGSMLAEDNHRPGEGPNRLQVIKPSFRPLCRTGRTIGWHRGFSTQAYTLSPLTFDHAGSPVSSHESRSRHRREPYRIGDGSVSR